MRCGRIMDKRTKKTWTPRLCNGNLKCKTTKAGKVQHRKGLAYQYHVCSRCKKEQLRLPEKD